ncbi:class I SAM-dependent methyltransferase, partial [Anaerolineae bacterium CFX8]|nr:class I SAM-dependent methyltransferase [Anaerolineae bacterium CFX8]
MSEDVKSRAQERFGPRAQNYVRSASHASGDDLERLVALAQPAADWLALDVAAGGGHTALKFAPHVARVVASDLTPPMLEAARSFIRQKGADNVIFSAGDAEMLPFKAETFDLVTCR